MIDVIKIASYISQRYEYQYGSRIDEMKLQILLYFIQRECIVRTGSSLFEATFMLIHSDHIFRKFMPHIFQIHCMMFCRQAF